MKLFKIFFQIPPKEKKIICIGAIIEANSLKIFEGVMTKSAKPKTDKDSGTCGLICWLSDISLYHF
jgi:hypothetical protein